MKTEQKVFLVKVSEKKCIEWAERHGKELTPSELELIKILLNKDLNNIDKFMENDNRYRRKSRADDEKCELAIEKDKTLLKKLSEVSK